MTSRLHGLLEGVFDAWVVSFASLRADFVDRPSFMEWKEEK